MSKFCFVSYEIHPTVSGGCGVLLHNAAQLLLTQGHEIIFLLDIPLHEFNQFNDYDRLTLPNPDNCKAYHVETVIPNLEYKPTDFISIFEFRSYRFHKAASQIYKQEKPEVIEFFDYCGVAYTALSSKVAGIDYQDTHIAVRLHSSLELIDRHQPGSIHGIDRYIMYGMEHHALRLAETVLYPSETFLKNGYSPHYERWFGDIELSKPPLVSMPEPIGENDNPDIILFFGRLHGIKGVDIFVDAAVNYLNGPSNQCKRFYLVGYDSYSPPGSQGSYQEYLWQKIPDNLRSYFYFTGKLSWKELGKLLPRVAFAVIPSYFESFCYAAHELYEAGVPLIVSNIPAFKDYFHHNENALVFDGTVSDLTTQLIRLCASDSLRKKLSRPYPITHEPLGDFYSIPSYKSWVTPNNVNTQLSLLVCIICDHTQRLEDTRQSLTLYKTDLIEIILLHPARQINEPHNEPIAWFLGDIYKFTDEWGDVLQPTQIRTKQAILILKAGDSVDPDFLNIGLTTLRRQNQISFVGCWKKHQNNIKVETLPYDVSIELLPFLHDSAFSRAVIRTQPETLLIDLFDPRCGQLGEIDYLWKVDTDDTCGVVLPHTYLEIGEEKSIDLRSNELDYMLIRDDNATRKKRLARFLLSLSNRATTLKAVHRVEPLDRFSQLFDILDPKEVITQSEPFNIKFRKWLSESWLNRWLNRFPRLKMLAKKAAKTLLG